MMMNYSIILFGASISLSLFIRICVVCGATGVNSEEPNNKNIIISNLYDFDALINWDDPLSVTLINDPLYQYGRLYKKILNVDGRYNGKENELEDEVQHRISYLRNAPISQTIPFNNKNTFQHDEGYYDEEICGLYQNHSSFYQFPMNSDRGIVTTTHDDNDDGGRLTTDYCFYKPEIDDSVDPTDETIERNLICNNRTMTVIPLLPPVLNALHISLTKISQISRSNFGNVKINSIQLIQNQIEEMEPYTFSTIKDITTLEIMDNPLTYLAFNIYFGLTEVIALNLDGNRISFEIYENCTARNVSDIPIVLPKLRLFSLKRNPITVIPAQMFAGLRESPLILMDLSDCELEYIDNEAFTFLPNLKTLYLTGNRKLLPNMEIAFEGLRNVALEGLSLGNTGFHAGFPKHVLSILNSTLKTLDLSENSITSLLTKDIPPNLYGLIQLNLARCALNYIQPGALDLFPNMIQLDLSHNDLRQIPVLSNLRRLMYLTITDNPIPPSPSGDQNGINITTLILDDSLNNLPKLVYLNLVNSWVRKIYKNTFTGLTNLQTLLLDNTKLEFIEDGSFNSLVSLSRLQLRNNPMLISINSLTFFGLNSLRVLDMDGCSINFPHPPSKEDLEKYSRPKITDKSVKLEDVPNPYTPFLFLPKLESLILTNNNISSIYPELFLDNHNITKLQFSGNQIKSWELPLLEPDFTKSRMKSDSNDRMLLLSKNDLDKITEAMIADIISFQANQMDFSGNLFVCNPEACTLRDLIHNDSNYFINDSSSIFFTDVIWLNEESYICVDGNGEQHKIVNVTNEICNRIFEGSQEIQVSSNWMTIIVISVVSVTGVLTASIIGYKQRAHIRYWLFRVKMNVTVLPRKAKTSIAELIQFDYDVFISYHNEDRNFILEKFIPQVEDPSVHSLVESKNSQSSYDMEDDKNGSKGFRVCLHERDFEAGLPITENIVDAVDRSKTVVIIVSKKYLESQWCTFEMNLAYHRLIEARRKSFLVILLEDIPTNLRTKVLNYLMRSRTYLEWPGESSSPQETKRFWNRLHTSLLNSE